MFRCICWLFRYPLAKCLFKFLDQLFYWIVFLLPILEVLLVLGMYCKHFPLWGIIFLNFHMVKFVNFVTLLISAFCILRILFLSKSQKCLLMIYSRSPNVLSFHVEINIIPGTDICSWYKVEFQDWKFSDLVYMDIQLAQQHWLKTILFLINCVLPLSYIMCSLWMFESFSQIP